MNARKSTLSCGCLKRSQRPPSSSKMTNETAEEYDSFDTGVFEFDPASLAHVDATAQAYLPSRNRFSGERSAATTQLATDVGSTVLRSRVPFLKSITFFEPKVYYRQVKEDGSNEQDDVMPTNEDDANDDVPDDAYDLSHWDIKLKDPPRDEKKGGVLRQLSRSKIGTKLKLSRSPRLIVQDFDGLLEFSSIQSGDLLLAVNNNKIDPKKYSAEWARGFMDECIENEGVLNLVTENPSGDDILIDITVIKPRPEMTYDELGLDVWNWPYLCVRKINKSSIFEHTPIQETDQIAAINDIDCSKMRAKEFARCVSELPKEITVTVIRRRHRYTASYS